MDRLARPWAQDAVVRVVDLSRGSHVQPDYGQPMCRDNNG